MSKTDESSFSRAAEYCAYTDNSSVFFHLPLIDIHLHEVDLMKKLIQVFQILFHLIDSNLPESIGFVYANHRLTL